MTIADNPTTAYAGAISIDPDTAEAPLPERERAKVPFAMQGWDFVPSER